MTPEILVGTRLTLHVITALLLASYYRPDSRFRLAPSVMAGLLLSSSAAMAVQCVTTWSDLVTHNPQPQLVIFVFAVTLPIAYARGDMAKLYDALRIAASQVWWWR